MARFSRLINNSINLKLLANRTLIPVAKRHYSICVLCENSLFNETSRVLSNNHRKCKKNFCVSLLPSDCIRGISTIINALITFYLSCSLILLVVDAGSTRSIHLTKSLLRKNYYDILGVTKNAAAKDIKKSYYQLAKKYHPDTNKNDPDAPKKFQEVSEAYEVRSTDTIELKIKMLIFPRISCRF